MTVINSTISGNSARSIGGGIDSECRFGGVTTITNSTISGNTAGRFGGGVFNSGGLTVIEFSTITNNIANEVRGGGVASDSPTQGVGGRTEVLSSIISANQGTEVDFVFSATTNPFVSNGYNLIGDGNATGAFNEAGDQTNVADPKLGALSDNGGPTKTHALLAGSPAVDKGNTDLTED